MGYLDRISAVGNLYIGGFHRLYSLRRKDAVKDANITHVVSVLRFDIDRQMIAPFKHLQIEVDDEDDENLLEYFPTTNKFIDDALGAGGSVFVHCAMGKSRSATVVIAYMMYKQRMGPDDALEKLRESRGVCDPNDGFKRQLKVYHSMGMPDDVETNPTYQRWLYQRELHLSRAIKQAPEADKIRFEDEHARAGGKGDVEYKCRKCRRTLATSQYLVSHSPKQNPDAPEQSPPVPPSACAHLFLDPLSWMRPELEQGKLDGRLECPKCKTNVGKYAWQGQLCSCGDWVVPGISLAKGRVDEAKLRFNHSQAATIEDRNETNSKAVRGPGQEHL